MALLKTRPKIRLLVPPEVRPGQRVTAEVVLDARREVPIDFVEVRVNSREQVRIGSGNHAQIHSYDWLQLESRLSGAGRLARGTTRYSCTFELTSSHGAALPPSYAGTSTTVEYTVVVHASIPWWPDARETFALVVTLPPQERQATHRVFATRVQGPDSREPHLEFTLESDLIVPGDTVKGQIALYNVAFNRYRSLLLSLVGTEPLRNNAGEALGRTEAHRYSAKLTLGATSEGEPFDFAIKLPHRLPPSFAGALGGLLWSFEIEAKIAWAHSLKAAAPIEVMPGGSKRSPRPQYAVPTIGSPRIMALWAQVAQEYRLELDPQTRRMIGRVRDTQVEVGRVHRGADGIFIQANLRYPDLELDIDGGLASGIRRVIGGGISLDDPVWDKLHYLTGREPAQIRAFAQALRELLLGTRLADIDDEHLILEMRDAGQSPAPLKRFVEHALRLADALPRARAMVPPPACMAEAVPSWRELARALGGELDVASMAVSGRYQEVPCAVATRWLPNGETQHTELSLDAVLSERHQLTFSEGKLVAGSTADLPTPARELWEKLIADCISLTLDRARIVLWDRAPLLEAKNALARLAQLAALSALLRGAHGPYR